MAPWCSADGDDTIIRLWVVPGARGAGIVGPHGDALKVRVAAPPEGGRANQAVLDLLERRLAAAVVLERGTSARAKTVRVAGVGPASVEALLTGE